MEIGQNRFVIARLSRYLPKMMTSATKKTRARMVTVSGARNTLATGSAKIISPPTVPNKRSRDQ